VLAVEFPRQVSAATRKAAQAATAWLGARLERLPLTAQVRPAVEGRAYYGGRNSAGKALIFLTDDAYSTATMIHELGHALEGQVPEALAASQAFLHHRVGQESPVALNDVVQGEQKPFESDERGRKDHFDRYFQGIRAYYVGLDYGDSATEILSMGLEAFYHDPVRFAEADPEYCAFVLRALSGDLRKEAG
jgi:hypothetical protein